MSQWQTGLHTTTKGILMTSLAYTSTYFCVMMWLNIISDPRVKLWSNKIIVRHIHSKFFLFWSRQLEKAQHHVRIALNGGKLNQSAPQADSLEVCLSPLVDWKSASLPEWWSPDIWIQPLFNWDLSETEWEKVSMWIHCVPNSPPGALPKLGLLFTHTRK